MTDCRRRRRRPCLRAADGRPRRRRRAGAPVRRPRPRDARRRTAPKRPPWPTSSPTCARPTPPPSARSSASGRVYRSRAPRDRPAHAPQPRRPAPAGPPVVALRACSTAPKSPMGARLLRRGSRTRSATPRRSPRASTPSTGPMSAPDRTRAVPGGPPRHARHRPASLGKVGARRRRPARPRTACAAACAPTLDLGVHLSRAATCPALLRDALRGARRRGRCRSSRSMPPSTRTRRPASTKAASSGPASRPEIDSLRAMTRDARGFLLGLERLERERTGIRTLKVGHNRVFGYYIEVSSANAAPGARALPAPPDARRRRTLRHGRAEGARVAARRRARPAGGARKAGLRAARRDRSRPSSPASRPSPTRSP